MPGAKLTRFNAFVLNNRKTIREIPGSLPPESAHAMVMSSLVGFLIGNPDTQISQCGVVWIPVSEDFASAMFLGGTWGLTAGHFFLEQANEYVMSVPLTEVAQATISTALQATNVPEPSGADLSLVRLNGTPQKVTGIPIASDAEVVAAKTVQLCGFGPSQCDLPARASIRRLSSPLQIVANPPASFGLNAGEFVVQGTSSTPVVCPGDSGGGVVISTANGFKLAGIILDQFAFDGLPASAKCLRLSPFVNWIKQVTGLPL